VERRLLLDVRQTAVLRTGGIHEKWFAVSASRFLLFQTVAHSHADRVRPEHRDLLDDADADSSDHAIVLRASAKVVAAIEVNRWEHVEEIAWLHIWTTDSVRTGWTFDPDTGTVLVVQAARWSSSCGWFACWTTRDAPAGCNYRYPPHGQSRCTTTRRRGVADRIRQAIA
jgi:hypothetical protein